MVYTKFQREQIRNAFIAAKPRLSPNGTMDKPQDRYLCQAIMNAARARELPGSRRKSVIRYALEAKSIIEERLGDCYTYESWIKTFHSNLADKDFTSAKGGTQTAMRKAQEARARWLDSLIQEFTK